MCGSVYMHIVMGVVVPGGKAHGCRVVYGLLWIAFEQMGDMWYVCPVEPGCSPLMDCAEQYVIALEGLGCSPLMDCAEQYVIALEGQFTHRGGICASTNVIAQVCVHSECGCSMECDGSQMGS